MLQNIYEGFFQQLQCFKSIIMILAPLLIILRDGTPCIFAVKLQRQQP